MQIFQQNIKTSKHSYVSPPERADEDTALRSFSALLIIILCVLATAVWLVVSTVSG